PAALELAQEALADAGRPRDLLQRLAAQLANRPQALAELDVHGAVRVFRARRCYFSHLQCRFSRVKRLYGRDVHGSTRPWWRDEAPPDDPLPPLEGTVDADVAVVGGGFTGLWTALELRRRRPSAHVVVLEAGRCGDGASGRNGGFLHGYWAALPRLIDLLGEERAVGIATEAEGAAAAVRALGEDVWLNESGMLLVSTGPAHDALLQRAVEAAVRVGRPAGAVLLRREELPLRSPVFRGAVRFQDGAT